MNKEHGIGGDLFGGNLVAFPKHAGRVLCDGLYKVECYSSKVLRSLPGGPARRTLRWEDEIHNIIVTAGLNYLVDIGLLNGTQITAWYVGLLAASPSPAAGWTATEVAAADFVNYDEATLQTFTGSAVSSGSTNNSASKAVFTISTNGSSIGGAFLISTNAKATPAGTLYSAGAFAGGNKAADDDDVLNVTATFSVADDGA